MWDLIVSVPDHCLSLYFVTCKKLHYLTDQFPCFIYCHIYLIKGGRINEIKIEGWTVWWTITY